MDDYRASIGYPLQKVTVGVRQFVARESSEVIVAQRLKRMPTILDKLGRESTMQLSRMQDVGGCRAVLPGGASEVEGVLRRIERRCDVRRVYDYNNRPKPTGYRGVHVIVLRDEREIEIQLRTPDQHDWALAVERLGARLGTSLKDGQGPTELLAYLQVVAELIALNERGLDPDAGLLVAMERLLPRVRSYLGTEE